MAIDTAEKRQSVPGVGRVFLRSHFPIASPDEQWRIGSGLAYAGNALSAAAAAIVFGVLRRVMHPVLINPVQGRRR